MKFQFVGDGEDGPKQIKAFGHDFTLDGEFVDVSDERVIAKLKGNGCFVHDGKDKPAKVRKTLTLKAEPEVEPEGDEDLEDAFTDKETDE